MQAGLDSKKKERRWVKPWNTRLSLMSIKILARLRIPYRQKWTLGIKASSDGPRAEHEEFVRLKIAA